MAACHLTGSKQLVGLLNQIGHSSSYDELQAVDTSLATEVLAKVETYGTVIPSNISPGSFVQFATNNNYLTLHSPNLFWNLIKFSSAKILKICRIFRLKDMITKLLQKLH